MFSCLSWIYFENFLDEFGTHSFTDRANPSHFMGEMPLVCLFMKILAKMEIKSFELDPVFT